MPSRNLQSYIAFALAVGKTCPVPKWNSCWVHSMPWHAQDKPHPAILVLEGESWVFLLDCHGKTGSNCFPSWFWYLISNCRPHKDEPSSMHPSLRFAYHSPAHFLLQPGEDVRNREMGRKSCSCWLPVLWWWAVEMLLCAADYRARFPKIFRPLKQEVATIFLRVTLLLSCNWYYS